MTKTIQCGTHKLFTQEDKLICSICGMMCWHNKGLIAGCVRNKIYVSMDDPIAYKYQNDFAETITCNDYIIMGIIK